MSLQHVELVFVGCILFLMKGDTPWEKGSFKTIKHHIEAPLQNFSGNGWSSCMLCLVSMWNTEEMVYYIKMKP